MEDFLAFCGLLVVVILIVALCIAGVNSCESDGMDIERTVWITEYTKKPYCESSTSEVRGKKTTVKRCWKVVEVNE